MHYPIKLWNDVPARFKLFDMKIFIFGLNVYIYILVFMKIIYLLVSHPDSAWVCTPWPWSKEQVQYHHVHNRVTQIFLKQCRINLHKIICVSKIQRLIHFNKVQRQLVSTALNVSTIVPQRFLSNFHTFIHLNLF